PGLDRDADDHRPAARPDDHDPDQHAPLPGGRPAERVRRRRVCGRRPGARLRLCVPGAEQRHPLELSRNGRRTPSKEQLMTARTRTTTIGAALSLGEGLLLTASGPAAAHEHGNDLAPAVQLRVASYNIAAGRDADGSFDIASTAEAIETIGADVMALQEVDVHWGERSLDLDLAEELAQALDMHVAFAPIYSNDPVDDGGPRAEFGVAVLSDYPIVDFTNHEITRLSTQDEDPVPAPGPGFAEATIQARAARVH